EVQNNSVSRLFSNFVELSGNVSFNLVADLTFNHDVFLAGNTALNVGPFGRTLTFTKSVSGLATLGQMSGFGRLTKDGQGTLVLSGHDVHGGGTLLVNGAIGGSGTGDILNLMGSAGVLSPGVGGPGIMTVSGGLALTPSTSLEIALNGTIAGAG